MKSLEHNQLAAAAATTRDYKSRKTMTRSQQMAMATGHIQSHSIPKLSPIQNWHNLIQLRNNISPSGDFF